MKKAGDLLGDYMRNLQLNMENGYSSVFKSWGNIAGEDMGSHSTVKDLNNGILLVEADHPGWIQLLQMRKKNILKNIQYHYPELDVIDIRFILENSQNKNIQG
jgi:predicted nucleic acid-binding Zn ribbon protein